MPGYWDEVGDGEPCRRIPPHDIPDLPPDWAAWSERLAAAGDRPPVWMGPVGRLSAWRAAARLRLALALALAAAFGTPAVLAIWFLGGLR